MNEVYLRLASLFAPLAVMHRFSLALAIALVFRGGRVTGARIMSMVFASMAFSVFYAQQSVDVMLTAAVFFVLMLCLFFDAYQPLTAWGKGKHLAQWARITAWALFAWALCDPRYTRPYWISPLTSPLGILPGPTLLALLAMLWLAFPQTNRLVHWAAALAGVLTSIRELVVFKSFFDVPLLIFSFVTIYGLLRSVRQSGGALEDDLSPKERYRAPSRADAEKNKVWKI